MSSASRARVRVRACAPLPAAQFVVPVRTGEESLADVRARILAALRGHHPAAILDNLDPDALVLSVDDFALLDEFGSDVLRDGEVVRYVLNSLTQRYLARAPTQTAAYGRRRRPRRGQSYCPVDARSQCA